MSVPRYLRCRHCGKPAAVQLAHTDRSKNVRVYGYCEQHAPLAPTQEETS